MYNILRNERGLDALRRKLIILYHSFDVGPPENQGASIIFSAVSVVNSYYIIHSLVLHWNHFSYQRLPLRLRWDLYLICIATFCLWRGGYFHDRKKCGVLKRRSCCLAWGQKWKNGVSGEGDGKLHPRENSYWIRFNHLKPTISPKISLKVPIVISYLAGLGLLEKPLQFLKFSESWHLIFSSQVW